MNSYSYAHPLNYKVGVIFFFKLHKEWRNEGGKVRKNIRSGEPVQNIINVNIWVGIYIEISYSHIFIWKHSHTYQYTNTKIQNATSHQAIDVGTTNHFFWPHITRAAISHSIWTWEQGDPVVFIYFFLEGGSYELNVCTDYLMTNLKKQSF